MINCRAEFAALSQKVNDKPLVYLDTAATALKPSSVVEVMQHFYQFEAANVHRGAHYLSDRATLKFEQAREKVRLFVGATSTDEIIFTSGTTDAINLVAQTYARKNFKPGDEILLTEMEHHSNIVPWQMVAEETGAVLRWAAVTPAGELDLHDFKAKLSAQTRLVAMTYCSNVLGTVNPIEELTKLSHAVGAKVLIDAAQAVTFLAIDVKKIDCDFLTFSAHKLYGPYGVGVLFGKKALLNEMPPYRGGGAMISQVTREKTVYLGPPQRFEAGTPNISGVIGLSAAIDFVEKQGLKKIADHERQILDLVIDKLKKNGRIRFVGESATRVNLISFNVDGIHSSDIGLVLDQQGVAVRVGHHCAQPLMSCFGINGTIRLSLGVYNSPEDVDIFMRALNKAEEFLK